MTGMTAHRFRHLIRKILTIVLVAAVNGMIASASAEPDAFGPEAAVQGSCTYTLLPTNQKMIPGGGSSSTAVLTPSGCPWTAVSNNSDWLTITSATSGSGEGTIEFVATANTTPSVRTGTLTIRGQTFTLTQGAALCLYSLSSTNATPAAAGGTLTVNVTALTGCTWTAVSNTSWATVTGGASGTGNGTVTIAVAANTSSLSRTGSVMIAGQAFTITQAPANCSFTVSPTSLAVAAGGTNSSATVTTTSSCSWTAFSNFNWITIANGTGRTGDGSVNFTVAANTSSLQRTGTMSIAGKTFTVTQAGNGCTFTLSPSSQTIASAGGSGTIAITTAASCTWSATTNQAWITVSGSGTGPGSANFTVQPNTGTTSRVGAVAVGPQVFTIIQNGGGTANVPASPTGLRIVFPAVN